MDEKNGKKYFGKILLFLLAEAFLLFIIISTFGGGVVGYGGSGGNVTVQSILKVGNVSPEVVNVTVNDYATSIDLTPNSTKNISCQALVRDWNGEGNITNVTSEFFISPGVYNGGYAAGPNDNNYHYTNNSCYINDSFGTWHGMVDDPYIALATCNYSIWYYAYPGTWNCTVFVDSIPKLNATGSNTTTINQLLAVGLPPSINFGTVNATYVSDENYTNVTNMGNVELNLSLYGYAQTLGDGYAMNCSVPLSTYHPKIPIGFEKYNLTVSHPGGLTLTQFETNYTNLTSTYTVRKFNLNFRENDAAQGTDDTNATYWRVYVPNGAAGTCTGNIVFGASTSPGS